MLNVKTLHYEIGKNKVTSDDQLLEIQNGNDDIVRLF